MAIRTSPCKFKRIKGHSGETMNEAADMQANSARTNESEALLFATVTNIQFFLGCNAGVLKQKTGSSSSSELPLV
jgi:hypothetical protein